MLNRLAIIFMAMLAVRPAFAQVNQLPHDLAPATSPLPDGSCWVVDQGPGLNRSLCHHWATAIGAWSSEFDNASVEGVFQIPSTDAFKIIYRTNHAPQNDTIQSPTVAGYGVGFGVAYFSVAQGNSVNPQGGAMLNNRAGYEFGANQGALFFSDGFNYRAIIGLPTASSQDSSQFLGNDNIYRQVGPAQLAPGAVTTPALASGLTLTSPSFTLGSDASGDIYIRGANGQLTRLPVGSANAVLAVAAGACTTDSNNVTTCAPNMPVYQNVLAPSAMPLATNNSPGAVRPDGQSNTVDPGGTLHVPLGIDTGTIDIAAAGTTQADCKALTTQQNYVSAIPQGAGVCLPPTPPFGHSFVCNETATPLPVYAEPGGSVISTPSGTLTATQAVSVGQGCVEFLRKTAALWWVFGPGVPLIVQ